MCTRLNPHRGRLARTLCFLILLTVAGTARIWLGSSSAAVELAYLRITAEPDRVRIEWGTGQEYNVQFFRILCKREDEPETSYKPIGNPVPAKGGLEESAEYVFVATGLARDVSYCFAVEEVTTDGEPGDLFPICGYGPGVTPTPTASPTPTETPTPSPTLTALSPLATPTPSPTEATTPTDTPTPTPIPLPTLYIVTTYTPTPQPAVAPETPTPLPTATPTPQPGLFGLGPGLAGMEFVIGLLCLSGLGIGGLGLLALLVSVFYVRSSR